MPSWKIAEGHLHECPIRIHFRDDLFPNERFPMCVRITWQATSLDQVRMPDQEEFKRIDKFNQFLLNVIEESGHGVLALVMLADGECQWVLYGTDESRFQSALESIPTEEGLYPIDVVSDLDPLWEIQQQLLAGIRHGENSG